jgi:hypothetical protein
MPAWAMIGDVLENIFQRVISLNFFTESEQ